MTSNVIGVRYNDPSIDKDNPAVPPIEVVQELIWVAFCVFNGSYMVSSLIESKNSVIRHTMPNRGLRTETHLRNQLAPRLQLGNPFAVLTAIPSHREAVPICGSVGFYNLDKFVTPSLGNLRVLSSYGGM